MHQKARALWRDGDVAQARRLAVRALDLLPPSEGDDLNNVADRLSILESLAQFASDLAQHEEAQHRCDDALAILKHVKSGAGQVEWTVALLVQKGNSQRLSARYDESELTLTNALALSERMADSPLLRVSPLNALGILAKDRARYEDAESYYNEALELFSEHVGRDAPELAGIYHNLAGLAHVQGNFSQAEEPARQAIRLRERASPPDSAGLAADRSVLGAVLAGLERFDEAEVNLSEALELWRTRYGGRHYEVAVQLHNLAAIQQAQKNYASAEASLGEALTIKREILGESHPEIAALLNNLATVYSDQDRLREAKESYDHAIEIFLQTLGSEHPSTIACIQNRSKLLRANDGV
jgi:tetratricopeptide (TPR) repeat protein